MSQSNQQFQQFMAELIPDIMNDALIYNQHKQELIKIVIDKNTNDDQKLQNLEDNILYFRANFSNNVQSQPTNNINFNAFKNLDLDDICEIIETVTKPSQTHSRFLESIGNVLRNNDSNQQKLQTIRKLLV